ncbi:MAG: glyoxalase [Bacteroidota bacterium]
MTANNTLSIRPFIGAKDYALSSSFYREVGFTGMIIGEKLTFFKLGGTGFYLQDYYVKDWVDNTMLFLEVEDADAFLDELRGKDLPNQFPGARLSDLVIRDWGREFFLHDPAGVLWHIGTFTG